MCHVLSFLCVDQPVITSFSLSDIDSSAPDSVRETVLLCAFITRKDDVHHCSDVERNKNRP